jgi:hypothetical protein
MASFDTINHGHVRQFLEQRIQDPRVLRLRSAHHISNVILPSGRVMGFAAAEWCSLAAFSQWRESTALAHWSLWRALLRDGRDVAASFATA